MNALRYSPYSDSFSKLVATSVALHGFVILVFLVRAAWLPSEPLIIRNSIRVDLVGLPDKVQPQPVAAPAPPSVAVKETPKKPAVKKPEVPSLKSNVDSQKKALERLKALDAIEKMKSEVQEAKAKPQPASHKGNVVTDGDGLTGLERLDFDRYFANLESQIKQNWNLPGWLSQGQLRAQALVLIDAQGQVVRQELIASSGNEVFDAQVLEAIDRSSPFPAPPGRLKDLLAMKGVVFNFPE